MKAFLFLILCASSISASDEAKTAKESTESSSSISPIKAIFGCYASSPELYITRHEKKPADSTHQRHGDFILSKESTKKPLEEITIAELRLIPSHHLNNRARITIILDKGTEADLFNNPAIDSFPDKLTIKDLITHYGYIPPNGGPTSSGHRIWLIAHPGK